MTTLSLSASIGEASAAEGYDPYQRYLSIFGIGDGQVLAIQADGALLWHRNDSWMNGTGMWAGGSGLVIGTGWNQFATVLGSGDGSIYAIRGDGTLLRHRYVVSDLETGVGVWEPSARIGSGWNRFAEVVGFGGDFYGRSADGEIFWSHYDARAERWTVLDRRLIGFDFRDHSLFADSDGVLYSFCRRFRWHRHIDGVWQSGSGTSIYGKLGDLVHQGIYFTGAGSFYYLHPDLPGSEPTGQLLMHRLKNWLAPCAAPKWTNGGAPTPVGAEWWIERGAALQAYPLARSVTAGEDALIAVSTTFPEFSWSVITVGGEKPTEVTPARTGTAAGRLQLLPGSDYLSTGCGWKPSVRVPTAGLSAGLYAVRLRGPHGLTRDVPFIVKPPPAARAQIAFLIPSLTHHAYNLWGGHSQYCSDLTGQQRSLSFDRPSRQTPIEATGRKEHTLYNDVMLLQWLTRQGYSFDLYDDLDLHRDADLFRDYEVVVLGGHPEYWSLAMRQGLSNFLTGGGNLVYAGGNGIFEAVDVDRTTNVITYRFSASEAAKASNETGTQASVGSRRFMSMLGYPASHLLGVTFRQVTDEAPFQVTAPTGHPLLAGTGLVHGSLFGVEGYNGAASGWEVDAVLPGWPDQATPDQIIAQGINPRGGADMIYRPTGHGGSVFSASSITFVGALAADAALSKLLNNVFGEMLGSAAVATTMSSADRSPAGPMVKSPASAPAPEQLAGD